MSQSIPVIGIGGYYGAGKDEVADHLVAKHGFVKIGMSKDLHGFLIRQNPWVSVQHELREHDIEPGVYRYADLFEAVGYVEMKKVKEVRRLLQDTGTKAGREFLDEDLWVNKIREEIETVISYGTPVVIPRMSYHNEQFMVRGFDGGDLWWVTRPSLTAARVVAAIDDALDTTKHSSENTLGPQDFNREILNDGSLEDLYKLTDDLIRLPSLRLEHPIADWPPYDH